MHFCNPFEDLYQKTIRRQMPQNVIFANMNKILVTGSNGQLGNAIRSISHEFKTMDFTFFNREILDFYSDKELKNLQETNFDYLINCAAYTAVDKAESE